MLKGIRKWFGLATLATLTLTLLPLDGRCQEGDSVLHLLIDLACPQKPQKPKKAQLFGVTATPRCPMGVCTGAACPWYCSEHCGQHTQACPVPDGGTVISGCRTMSCPNCAATCVTPPCSRCPSCPAACPACKEGKCGEDCVHGCRGNCEMCPGCAVDRIAIAVRCTHDAAGTHVLCSGNTFDMQRLMALHHMVAQREHAMRRLELMVGDLQTELSALRDEVHALRTTLQNINYVPMPFPVGQGFQYYQYTPVVPMMPVTNGTAPEPIRAPQPIPDTQPEDR
jgi:hypothetical protein